MLLREPDGRVFDISGGTPHYLGDPDLVQRLVNAGIPLINVKRGDTGWWQPSKDIQAMPGRVREMKDLLTDYPGMEPGLKNTSLLRQIAGKLQISPRK